MVQFTSRPAGVRVLSGFAAAAVALAGCAGGGGGENAAGDGPLRVATTFSLLGELTEEIGGDHVSVHSMVPLGTDPHEYQPLPADIEHATEADLIVWNGLEMETGDGWFTKLVEVTGKDFDSSEVVAAAEDVEPQWLTEGEEEEMNPHAFLSPKAGLSYVERITRGLAQIDPGNAADFEANAEALAESIEEFDQRYAEELGAVGTPVLVTSERAFQYVAADYGLTEGYLFQIDTDEQGSPEQITSLVEFVKEYEPAGLLVETNVDARPMETVSGETGVPIVAEVYSDELGPEGSPGETYLGYLQANLESYVAAMN